MHVGRLVQFSCFGPALFCFYKIKTSVDDNSTDPCVESGLCGVVPVNIFKYFIKTCVQYFQSVCFGFCIAETKVRHYPVVAPVQLLLGFAVPGFAAADDTIYVLFFANQTIFSGLKFPDRNIRPIREILFFIYYNLLALKEPLIVCVAPVASVNCPEKLPS